MMGEITSPFTTNMEINRHEEQLTLEGEANGPHWRYYFEPFSMLLSVSGYTYTPPSIEARKVICYCELGEKSVDENDHITFYSLVRDYKHDSSAVS